MKPEEVEISKSEQAERLLGDLRLYNGIQMKLMKRKLGELEGGASANFELWIDCCSPEYREAFFQTVHDDPDFLGRYSESEGEALKAIEERIEMLQELEKQLVQKLMGEVTDPAFIAWHREHASKLMKILHENRGLAEPFMNHTHDDSAEEEEALKKIEALLKPQN